MAIGILDSCYERNIELSYLVLTRQLKNWSWATSLDIAELTENMEFIAHPASQAKLVDNFFGRWQPIATSHFQIPTILVSE